MRRSSEGDSAARELNELRLVFANIAGYTKHVGLRTILKLPELEAQIAEGDLHVEDLESIWLEACAVKGDTTALDPGDDGEEKRTQRASWGVCTELPFEGFVHFLKLCEERVLFPKGIALSPETSPRNAKTGRDLVAARHRMLGLLRASLTLHQRGGVSDGEGEDHQKHQNAPLGETLHATMVRAALEEGLAHHTPETLQELVRTGVYKTSESGTEKEETKASLGRHLLKQASRGDSIGDGIALLKSMSGGLAVERPASAEKARDRRSSGRGLADSGVVSGEAHEQHLLAAAKVSHCLESRPSPEEMRASHIVHTPAEDALRLAEVEATKSMLADMYGTQDDSSLKLGDVNSRTPGSGHHHRRPSLNELKSSGIYRTPEELAATGQQHKLAGTFLEQELSHRIDVSELKDRGIYMNRDGEVKQRLERSMRSDQLSKSLKSRPYIEDLMDRGVLESSQLENTFQELEKTGPVKTVEDVLKCPVINSAIKEGVVSRAKLETSFSKVQNVKGALGMSFQDFDSFLSTTETNQVEEEPVSLKLWTLMRLRPELDEQNHREGNRRRNALMAKELEQELGKREPLERLANKGIYLDRTAAKGAVERAHLVHTLAHGLAHRPDLAELSHTGIYLGRTTPLQHSLERHLIGQRIARSLQNPRRPTKQDLVDHGIYIDATPRELQMEHYLAARNLKHALRERETVQDLKDHGLYQPHDGERAAHEKRLLKALLQRKLSHAFSSEEVARLKQKGVYKAVEHEKLEAERLLVTRQLARLVSERPNPTQLEREHPGLMEESTLALVFEERVMPRSGGGKEADAEGEEADADGGAGGPEHLVSFEGLMTWPDVQEFLEGEGGDDARHEMAQHFELCDGDSDGFITFSQFLRWVELCGLNPDDHLQVTDADLDAEYAKLGGERDKGVTLEQTMSCRLVKRWSTSASLSFKELDALWGGSDSAGSMKRADKFKAFCRRCEARSLTAHEGRLADLQVEASKEEAKAKADLRARLSKKLTARPDLEELKRARIYRSGGLDPATEHLERNLIAISLKERLLARPALEDLEKRGIKPRQGTKTEHEKHISKLRQALDLTMQHDDAQWRSHPSQLGAGPREEVSALLQKSLSKRISIQQLTNKGIYVVDTDASYALLVHQVLRTHRGFVRSCAQLITGL